MDRNPSGKKVLHFGPAPATVKFPLVTAAISGDKKAMESMDEMITSLSAKLGLPEATVRSGLGVLLKLLKERAAGTQFEELLNKLPGASDAMASAPAGETGGGGGLLGALLGGSGDMARAFGALGAAGVPTDKMLPLAKGFLDHARVAVGPEVIDQVVKSVPALNGLLGSRS